MFQDFPFSGVSDFIIKVLYLIISVFKSYTIDLLDSNTVWNIDDKSFNAIRLFDELSNEIETDKMISKVSLEDVTRGWEYDLIKEDTLLNMKDSVNITTDDDNSQPDTEIELVNL
jgi:hypothetical protein